MYDAPKRAQETRTGAVTLTDAERTQIAANNPMLPPPFWYGAARLSIDEDATSEDVLALAEHIFSRGGRATLPAQSGMNGERIKSTQQTRLETVGGDRFSGAPRESTRAPERRRHEREHTSPRRERRRREASARADRKKYSRTSDVGGHYDVSPHASAARLARFGPHGTGT